MNDRELLELAAKAAGINIYWEDQTDGGGLYTYRRLENGQKELYSWNPLKDDGDALRLAVQLNLTIHDFKNWIAISWDGHSKEIEEEATNLMSPENRCRLLRRAIVRAAVEILRDK